MAFFGLKTAKNRHFLTIKPSKNGYKKSGKILPDFLCIFVIKFLFFYLLKTIFAKAQIPARIDVIPPIIAPAPITK